MNLNFIAKLTGTNKYGRIVLLETSDVETFNAFVNTGVLQSSNPDQIADHADELERQGFVQFYAPLNRLVEGLATLEHVRMAGSVPRINSRRFGANFSPLPRLARLAALRFVRNILRGEQAERVTTLTPNIETYGIGTL